MTNAERQLRVGQFSAYYGDRTDTIGPLLDAGVDVLTGDYLAELTMLVLRKNQLRGGVGFAAGFVPQLRADLKRIAEQGVKVITNAGGLAPEECAQAIRDAAAELGLELKVAAITGDNLIDELPRLAAEGEKFLNLDDGRALQLSGANVLTANAYLGAWPIVEALRSGADIVIAPRVTDASLVIGPAAWFFDWRPTDYGRLAGALWAGHAIECGGQITGGNFSLFHRYGDLGQPGMPIAEIADDGSFVVTKAEGSGGLVNVDTVTAQLLYEVGAAAYRNPDVTADLSSVAFAQVGPDRVQVTGARGYAPGRFTKLSLGYEGGFRNTITVGITGAHVAEKVEWLRREVIKAVGAPETFGQFRWSVIGPLDSNTGTFEDATAWVLITVRDEDPRKVGRKGFSSPITQLGVSNIPGFYLSQPPQKERLVGVQWPCLVPKDAIRPAVSLGGDADPVAVTWDETTLADAEFVAAEEARTSSPGIVTGDPTTRTLFGDVFGTRSGDKAGTANLGVWSANAEQHDWLRDFLTIDKLRDLFPQLAGLTIERHVLSNIHALNFQLFGYLEEGVASCTRVDPQAKGVGEFLGSRYVDIPTRLLTDIDGAAARTT
jgi:hypothetical protein